MAAVSSKKQLGLYTQHPLPLPFDMSLQWFHTPLQYSFKLLILPLNILNLQFYKLRPSEIGIIYATYKIHLFWNQLTEHIHMIPTSCSAFCISVSPNLQELENQVKSQLNATVSPNQCLFISIIVMSKES